MKTASKIGYWSAILSVVFAIGYSNPQLYRGLLSSGLLMPVLVLAFFYPVFYYIGAIVDDNISACYD